MIDWQKSDEKIRHLSNPWYSSNSEDFPFAGIQLAPEPSKEIRKSAAICGA
jgi:hypothetical protein